MFKKKKIEKVEDALDRKIESNHYKLGLSFGKRRDFRFRPWVEYVYYDGHHYTLNLGFYYIAFRR